MKPERKAFLKKWLRKLAWLPVLLLLFVALLELFYRNQWIDTYKRELNALNPVEFPANPKKKVLVMGDSFSAATNTWVDVLRKQHPDWQIVNSAVPGTTILQANLMLENRLSEFKPDLLIYQIYVGNDLFDLRYPLNWGEIGFFRNLYWATANRIRSLAWFNYALGQFKRSVALPDFQQGKVDEGEFDPAKYSERERLYIKAEPGMIVDQALLQGRRAKDMAHYQEILGEFLKAAKTANCPVMLVAIPHCAQVSRQYAQRMTMLGAAGMDSQALQAEAYPFWTEIEAHQGMATGGLLNLLPRLRALESSGIPAYYLHDTHLTDAGQAAVADAIEAALNPNP
ncbi:MAG: hypothetical protein RLZZ519_712 [Bacteroidota bacterium]|jgi:hypothetical protein